MIVRLVTTEEPFSGEPGSFGGDERLRDADGPADDSAHLPPNPQSKELFTPGPVPPGGELHALCAGRAPDGPDEIEAETGPAAVRAAVRAPSVFADFRTLPFFLLTAVSLTAVAIAVSPASPVTD